MINKLVNKYQLLPIQVKASLWFLICSFLQKGISVISTPIFTRLMTSSEYGNYSVFNSWLDILTIFVSLRLYYGVYSQGLIKFEKDRDEFSSSMQGLTLTMVLVWIMLYLLSHNFWNKLLSLTTIQVLAMFIMIWTTAVFRFWAAENRVLYRYQKLVILTLLVSLAKPTIGIIFVYFAKDKVIARIFGLVLVELIGYTALFFAQMKRGKCFYSKRFWKYALAFNIPLIPHYLSQTVLNSADRIMIKNMVGPTEAGIYSLAYSVSQLMTLFNQALSQTITPWIYIKIKKGKPQDISKVAYMVLILIAGVNLLLIALAPEAVSVFAPTEYHEAIWVIPPVAMSVYFVFAYGLFADFEFYFEKTQFIMLASVMGALLNICLNYIFIQIFGYYAAGYTTLVCYIVYAIGHYIFMRKICKEHLNNSKVYDEKILLSITGIFMVIGFLLLLTYRIVFLRYLFIFVMLCTVIAKRKILMSIINQVMLLRKSEKT